MAKVNRPVWKETVIDLLMRRDRHICAICNEPMHKGELFEIHHIQPKSKGGDDSFANLAPVHLVCHKMKHNKQQQVAKGKVKKMVGTLKERVEKTETEAILEWLTKTDWNVTRTAQALDVTRPTLYEKMQKYGIQK